jgi:dTDP-4-amino-4,6-dideoxygalactose transaminase
MTVSFFDYARVYESEKNQVKSIIDDVLSRSDFILRKDLEIFEEEMRRYFDSTFMVGVANGTDAIWLALQALGIGKGDEVIIPSHTYIATADAIHLVGGIPVLVDCDDDHLVSVEAIKEAISPRTTCIIPVNLNGRACRLDDIVSIASSKGLAVIEDNAQGLGAQLNQKFAGTFGSAGTLSFFPAKNLGCYGDGGGIFVQDEEIARTLRQLRNHGRDETGKVISWGVNSRLDNLQAAILNSKLKFLSATLNKRQQLSSIYFERLGDLEDIKLPPQILPGESRVDVFQNFEIEVGQREALMNFLGSRQIGFAQPWGGKAVHQFELEGIKVRSLDKTESLFKRVLLLPMNQYLTTREVEQVCSTIREFYQGD